MLAAGRRRDRRRRQAGPHDLCELTAWNSTGHRKQHWRSATGTGDLPANKLADLT